MTFASNFENLEISESRRRSPRGRRSVLSTIREDERFSTLVKVLESSRAIGDLDSSKEEFTLFAPTNHAFKKLQERVAFQSMDDQDLVMEEVVRYHMIRGPVVYSQNLYQGQLLTTELKERSLDGAYQKIRVDRVAGNVRLNDLASVSETDIDAANGVVHVLDNVLIPPESIYDQIYKMPVQFSIFTTAMQQCRLEHDAVKDKAITCLIPNNEAWQELNKEDVSYLFSRAGATDLKRIVEYHMVKNLVYARDIIQDRDMELNTFGHPERICVSAIQRTDIPNLDEYNPNDWIITVNDGEAKIIAADFLSRNGNVHEISSVLIPESVVLPSMSGGRRGRRDGERRRWDGRRDGRRNDDGEERRRRRRSLQ